MRQGSHPLAANTKLGVFGHLGMDPSLPLSVGLESVPRVCRITAHSGPALLSHASAQRSLRSSFGDMPRPLAPPQLPSQWCPCPQFLRDTLAVISDNMWICQLSLEMCKQLPSYSGTPQEKVKGRASLGSQCGHQAPVPMLVSHDLVAWESQEKKG